MKSRHGSFFHILSKSKVARTAVSACLNAIFLNLVSLVNSTDCSKYTTPQINL
jgi:hypothetical protein